MKNVFPKWMTKWLWFREVNIGRDAYWYWLYLVDLGADSPGTGMTLKKIAREFRWRRYCLMENKNYKTYYVSLTKQENGEGASKKPWLQRY